MDFIYIFWPLLLVVLVAAALFRTRARPTRRPTVTRSRAWRDQSGPANPFPNTTVVTENDALTYAAFGAAPSADPDIAPACADGGSNSGGSTDNASICSDTSSTSTY